MFRWRKSTMVSKATLEDTVLAESDDIVALEGNAYFPPDAVRWEHLVESDHTTVCPWKGVASYFDAVIDDETHRNVGWTYRTPSAKAQSITGHVAFWGKVNLT
jgi:uncharacterized protein (DUF427 family)